MELHFAHKILIAQQPAGTSSTQSIWFKERIVCVMALTALQISLLVLEKKIKKSIIMSA